MDNKQTTHNATLPGGTVTFLFTDIEGSTQLLHQLKEVYADLLAEHHRLLRGSIAKWKGREIDTQGDAFFVSYARATDAVHCVVEMQRALALHKWPGGYEVRVRMGLHTGEPWQAVEGYVGVDVHRAARIAHIGHGGQVLLSETTAALVTDDLPEGVELLDLGRHLLKDMHRPEHIRQLAIAGLQIEFPPIKSLEKLPEAKTRQPREVGECPYRGLAAFHEADAPFFFGREAFTDKLHQAVKTQPLVAVIVGSSGSGKSSVVFAGLLPRLRQETNWRIVKIRPSGQPFLALTTALLPLIEPDTRPSERLVPAQKMAEAIKSGELPIANILDQVFENEIESTNLLLIIDQFEEIYTLCTDDNLRRHFKDQLLGALESFSKDYQNKRFVQLLTMRADFMGQALAHRPFADALQESSLLMGPMTKEELRTAIEKPAETQGAAFEPGLIERILDDVGDEPGNLPLLEFALTLLWEAQSDGWLTHANYEAIGCVQGALARYADEVYDELGEAEQEQAQRVFVQLVRPGEGTEDTRRLARREELGEADWGLVQRLADRRLVVTGRHAPSSAETVEVVHEALIYRWARLREWMNEARAFRTWQERLRAALNQWKLSDQDEGALLRGMPLAEAEAWLVDRGSDISAEEAAFIQAGAYLRERRAAEKEQQRRRIVTGLAVGFAVALLLALLAGWQWIRARQSGDLALNRQYAAETAQAQEAAQRAAAQTAQAQEADQRSAAQAAEEQAENERQSAQAQALRALASSLAGQSQLSHDNPELAVLLGLEAFRFWDTPQTKGALLDAIQNSPGHVRFQPSHARHWDSLALSPDGGTIAIGGWDGLVRMWSLPNGEPVGEPLEGNRKIVYGMVYSPDGKYLVSTSCDLNEAREWCQGDETFIWDMSASPVSGASFNSGLAWTMRPAFSHDGQILALMGCLEQAVPFGSGAVDCAKAEVVLWDFPALLESAPDPVAEAELGRIPLDMQRIGNLAINKDGLIAIGGCLVEGGADHCTSGEVVLWDLAARRRVGVIGPTDFVLVMDVAISPDGKTLAVAGNDEYDPIEAYISGVIQLWDLETRGPIEDIDDRYWPATDIVDSLAFSPDGKTLASGLGGVGEQGGSIILWDLDLGVQIDNPLFGQTGSIHGVAFTSDGDRLVSVSDVGTFGVWDLTTRGGIGALLARYEPVLASVAIHPDGDALLFGGDKAAYVLDSHSGEPLLGSPLTAHNDYLISVAFSPDGSRFATASFDTSIQLWDYASGEPLGPPLWPKLYLPQEESYGTFGIAFSPDGAWLAAGGHYAADRGPIYLWQVDSILAGQPISQTLEGHSDFIRRLAFSPDGSLMASSSIDRTIRLWDTQTWKNIAELTGINPTGLAFHPDGGLLASGDARGPIHLWDLDTMELYGSPLIGHTMYVMNLAFSPDGALLASTSDDQTVRIWDLASGQSIGSGLRGYGRYWGNIGFSGVAFYPDGLTLASSGFDGGARLWDLGIDNWVALACRLVGRNLTQEEWRKYLPDIPYRLTCEQWLAGE